MVIDRLSIWDCLIVVLEDVQFFFFFLIVCIFILHVKWNAVGVFVSFPRLLQIFLRLLSSVSSAVFFACDWNSF